MSTERVQIMSDAENGAKRRDTVGEHKATTRVKQCNGKHLISSYEIKIICILSRADNSKRNAPGDNKVGTHEKLRTNQTSASCSL